MTFIYFVTNSAWNPNTWAILCGILAVFLIVVLAQFENLGELVKMAIFDA